MKRRRKKNLLFLFMLLLLFISMGYALISTQLIINGETVISRNVWSVYWDNPVVNEDSISQTLPVLSAETGKTQNTIATWEVILDKPGDFYEFTIDAVNNGTIDAMISGINSTITDSNDDPVELPEYIKYSFTYDDGTSIANNHLLAKASGKPTTEKYKVKVYYDETVVTRNDINNMESGVSYNFTLDVTYSQADSNAFIRDKGTFLNGMDLNTKIKKIAGNSSATSSSTDSNIRAIKHSLVEPVTSNKQEANVVSVDGTQYPIYMWYEDGTLYWWSLDEKPALNADATSAFGRLLSLSDLEGLRDIDVSKTTTLFAAFYDCPSIQNVEALSSWDVSNVRNMGWLFGIQDVVTNAGYQGSLNDLTGLKNWDVSNVQTMNQIFINIGSLTSLDGLEDWKTLSLTNMSCMFEQDSALVDIEALRGWDTSKVTTMYSLFQSSPSITSLEPISEWDTGKVESFGSAFFDCDGLTSIEDIEEWDTSSVTTMEWMFDECSNLTSADLSGWNVSKVTTMRGLFFQCSKLTTVNLSGWNASKVEDMAGMFYVCPALTSVNFTGINTSSATNMFGMFAGCEALTSLDLSSLDTGSVTDMTGMFEGCSKLTTVNLNNWDTRNVTVMAGMFNLCSSLTSLNLSSFNTSKVTSMESMFMSCSKLSSLDLSSFDMSKTTNTRAMFQGVGFKNIIMPNNYIKLDIFMFNHNSAYNQESFTIPKSVKTVEYSHIFYNFGNTNFKKFIVEEGSTTLKTIDDLLYTYDGTKLISIPNGKEFTDNTYVMPDSVTTLNTMCFNRTQKIDKVVISDNLVIDRYYDDTSSGDVDPVKGNRLNTGIYVYTSVKEYEAKETNTNYSSYGGCIYNKTGTELISVPIKYTGVLNIKEGTTTIGQEAFWAQRVSKMDAITEINIQASITTIEANQLTTLNKLITNGVVINIDSNNNSYMISNNKIVAK